MCRGPKSTSLACDGRIADKKAGGDLPERSPALLGGEAVDSAASTIPRVPLMDWLRRRDNPYFARAW